MERSRVQSQELVGLQVDMATQQVAEQFQSLCMRSKVGAHRGWIGGEAQHRDELRNEQEA